MALRVNAKAKKKSVVIDTGLVRKELEAALGTSRIRSGVTQVKKIIGEVANDVVDELNKRSSMRENQGAGSPYFERTDINRAVKNKPFENANIAVRSTKTKGIKASISAPVMPTKPGSTPVDVFDILESGRPQKKLPKGKFVVFPVTRTGAERLIKKRLKSVRSVKKIFRAQKARYKKKNGKIALAFLPYLPKVEARNILGVIARDIEDRIADREITLKTLGIKGKIGKDKVKVRVE